MSDRNATTTRHLTVLETKDEVRLRTWLELARTFSLIYRRIVSALAERDVTMPQFDILATLRFSEGATQQELAQRLLVTKGNVCGVLNRLEAISLVERRQDPNDARSNRLYLTARGRKKMAELLPEHDALVLDLMRTLADADVKSLRRILQTLGGGITETA